MNADLFRPKEKRPLRRNSDYYPTPSWVIEEALNLVESVPFRILDPGAGEGQWGTVARQRWPVAHLVGVDIRPTLVCDAYNEWSVTDFRDWESWPLFDLVIGNPPYGYASDFLCRSLSLLRDGGELVFLLRLQFLCGQARARGLYREHPPKDIAFCSKRVSFYGDRTGSDDYCVLRWQKGWHGAPTVHWIGSEYCELIERRISRAQVPLALGL